MIHGFSVIKKWSEFILVAAIVLSLALFHPLETCECGHVGSFRWQEERMCKRPLHHLVPEGCKLGIHLDIRFKILANSRHMIDTLINKMVNKFRENWSGSFRKSDAQNQKCENLTFNCLAGPDEAMYDYKDQFI
jgi:hypothetical protein